MAVEEGERLHEDRGDKSEPRDWREKIAPFARATVASSKSPEGLSFKFAIRS